MPLTLLTPDKRLDRMILVAKRLRHEPSFVAKAVRQRGRMLLTFNDRTFNRFVTEGPTLRESLVLCLESLGTHVSSSTSTAGVGRQVRHTGTFAEQSMTTQTKNKNTVRLAAATVCPLLSPSMALIDVPPRNSFTTAS